MYYKCELLVGGGVYAVTDLVKNWDDITASFKRNDYDGIVRTFTDKFEFVGGARRLLLDEYKANYLKASASVVLSTRNNSWTWTERFKCSLNFSTLSDDGMVASINAVDDSVAALIKAKRGTEYEYSVAEVRDLKKLYYDGLMMKNHVVTGIPPTNEDGDAVDFEMKDNGFYTIPLYTEVSEVVRRNDVEVSDQVQSFYKEVDWLTEDVTFFKNKTKDYLLVKFRAKFSVFHNSQNLPGETHNEIILDSYAKGQIPMRHYSFNLPSTGYFYTHVLDIDQVLVIPPGHGLQFYLFSQYGKAAVSIRNVEIKPTIDWESRLDAVELDVIKPEKMLNRLLRSMNGGEDGLTGVIVPSGEKRLDNALLLAAESARMMKGAKVYSSFSKFCQWMSSVFGYVYDIDGKVVTFRPRKDYFSEEVVKEVKDYRNYQMSINSGLIYSQVNVGYDKQDYDSVNGKDEFRFMNIYNTGITLTDGKLELISPYRADAYGIQFMTQRIGEETSDNESDNDMFFVCAKADGVNYVLDRTDLITGVISPLTMFNAMYAPSSMIEANKDYLAGLISELDYASSEGNTGISINGLMENRNIKLEGGLFGVSEVEIETSDIEIPENLTGMVQFEHQGELIRGYYKSVDSHYTRTGSAKIVLIKKK